MFQKWISLWEGTGRIWLFLLVCSYLSFHHLRVPFLPSHSSFKSPPPLEYFAPDVFLWIKGVQGSSKLPGKELSNEGEAFTHSHTHSHDHLVREMHTCWFPLLQISLKFLLLLKTCLKTNPAICQRSVMVPSGWAQLLCSCQPLSNDMNLFCHYVQNAFSSF